MNMPRVKPKRKFKDDEVVVCWMPYATSEYTIPHGTRLRGAHPAVRANPNWFVPDGTPESEIPRAEIVPEEHAPEFYRHAPPIPDDEAAVATVNLQIGATYLQKGQ